GRILEAQLVVRAANVERRLRHERCLVEARQNELQFARIGVDVADGKDAGRLTLESRSIHRDQILMQVQAELGDWSEFDGETEEGKQRIGPMAPFLFVGRGQRDGFKDAIFAMERFYARDMEVDLAFTDELAHAIDTVLRRAETVAVVHESEPL